MTAPVSGPVTGVSGTYLYPIVPAEVTQIVAVDIPGGDFWVVRAPDGQQESLIDRYSLEAALVTGNAIVPVWSDPEALVRVHGLTPLVAATKALAVEVFGPAATLKLEIVHDPESGSPSLVLLLRIAEEQSALRSAFMRRYSREITIPEPAPIPVILWDYADSVSA